MAGKERRQGLSSRTEMTALLQNRARTRDRAVVGLNDTVFAAWIARRLRRLGWGVHLARSAAKVRQLTNEFSPQVVVLETRLADETGWLTCEKILRDDPTIKVVLVASQPEWNSQAFAEFVGAAALISQEDGVQALIDQIVETSPSII
jgi:ActR/RegA family two-component response regulator